MATHSSVLAWRIPGTGEPGGLPSMGLHRVGQDWRDLAETADKFEKHEGYSINEKSKRGPKINVKKIHFSILIFYGLPR